MTQDDQGKTLGTFLGVYTPTILTILGVIMYLRSGWLIGHLGLVQTLVVVALANLITIITTLSFSSVATNTRVGIAGAYFITSRSLGLAIGAAIGLPLFFSQTFSVTLYSFGLAEALQIIWPAVPLQAATLIIVAAVGLLAFLGAGIALRVQLPVMILIGISLIALVVGALHRAPAGNTAIFAPSGEITFWQGFAVFFPAVTGVMAGLGLSGDLKNPGRAIPLGSLLAVLTGLLIYLAIPFLLVKGASPQQLRTDPMIWVRIAPLGLWVILPGLLGAIFSSAVGSMLGAPRTLQALALDGLIPRWLGRLGQSRLVLLPGFLAAIPIALAAVFLGGLNAVAPVVTMFFLTIYGMVNIVAAVETISGDPFWRPRLRVPWAVSLLGALACMGAMMLINPVAGLIALAAEAILWAALSRREQHARWGDARRGLYQAIIRWALLRLAKRPMRARNWRPNILAFVSDPVQHLDLIRFANWFSQERGVVTVCKLVRGDLLEEEINLAAERRQMQQVLHQERLFAFPEVTVVHEIVEGIASVSQANGLGAMVSNTILLGWPQDRALLTEFLRIMRRLERVGRSLVIGRLTPGSLRSDRGSGRKVHVWWGGMQRNGDLMLLLAYLLTCNRDWQGAEVEVLSLASNEMARVHTETYLQRLIPEIRIKATPRVIIKPKDRSVLEVIHEVSADAQVVFFGLATPAAGEAEAYAARMEELAGGLANLFFVKNSSLFVGDLLTPDAPRSGNRSIEHPEESPPSPG